MGKTIHALLNSTDKQLPELPFPDQFAEYLSRIYEKDFIGQPQAEHADVDPAHRCLFDEKGQSSSQPKGA